MKAPFFVHPQALVESKTIGKGTRVWAFAHVMPGAVIGEGCNLGDHSFVESGARVGNNVTVKNGAAIWEGVDIHDNVFIGPNAVFTNDLNPRSPRFAPVATRYQTKGWLSTTVVEEGASIGANATIRCGVRIGRLAMIGAGAVVTKDVPAHALVLGVPGVVVGHVCECGQKLRFTRLKARCGTCGKNYRKSHGDLLAA